MMPVDRVLLVHIELEKFVVIVALVVLVPGIWSLNLGSIAK